KSLDELIPWLYLKGVSSGDFTDALKALLGAGAKGLSANVVVKLKEQWNVEFESWTKRDLSAKEYVYIWADGVYFNIRLDAEDRHPRDLPRRDEEGRHEGVRHVRGEVRRQLRCRDLVPQEGPRRAARVLRLPRRALEAHPHEQSDRVHVRDRSSSPPAHEGE